MKKKCADCGKKIAVRGDGTFVLHAYPGFPVECPGSGRKA